MNIIETLLLKTIWWSIISDLMKFVIVSSCHFQVLNFQFLHWNFKMDKFSSGQSSFLSFLPIFFRLDFSWHQASGFEIFLDRTLVTRTLVAERRIGVVIENAMMTVNTFVIGEPSVPRPVPLPPIRAMISPPRVTRSSFSRTVLSGHQRISE